MGAASSDAKRNICTFLQLSTKSHSSGYLCWLRRQLPQRIIIYACGASSSLPRYPGDCNLVLILNF